MIYLIVNQKYYTIQNTGLSRILRLIRYKLVLEEDRNEFKEKTENFRNYYCNRSDRHGRYRCRTCNFYVV